MSPIGASLSGIAVDGWVVALRNLRKVTRVPDLMGFVLFQPILFVMLFTYVFGGAFGVEGISYKDFLMAGIFTQTMVFGSTLTGAGLADDMRKGIIDRFRSLPMVRSAVLIGRTTSDLIINLFVVTVMACTGLVVGWRVHSSPLEFMAGIGLLLLFAYAMSWVMALVGLSVRSPEVVNNASFVILFPITFIASTFVPSSTLPTPLRVFAEWNPISSVTQAARELFGNTSPELPTPDAWPQQNAILATVLWAAVILSVFVPLSVRQYQRTASR
jgi:ABC transporter DrrB family efflux protein